MSIKSVVCQIRLSRWRACAVGASLAASATLASPGASAQGFFYNMMRFQNQMYIRGQTAVANMYNICIQNPGACQPWQADVNRQLQEQYNRNFIATQQNYNRIYNTNETYDYCVIQQRSLIQQLPNGAWRRVC
jgi:hypothetical protein